MPAPLAHIAYAEEYRKNRPELNERVLMRGTVFPDSRYLTGVARELTHRVNVEIVRSEIDSETDAWQVGWLLHSQLDNRWNSFMYQFGLGYGNPADETTWLALKLVEHDRLPRAQPLLAQAAIWFDGVPDPHELKQGASREAISRWDEWTAFIIKGSYKSTGWTKQANSVLGYDLEGLAAVVRKAEMLDKDVVWTERLRKLHEELGYGLV